MTCVTGVSSGKSTLVNDTCLKCPQELNGATADVPSPYESVDGFQYLDKVVDIDQSPIGGRHV